METNKVSALFLVATKTSNPDVNKVMNELTNMIGSLNCEMNDSDIAALRIDYEVSEEQQEKLSEYVRKQGYEPMFVIAPMECKNIRESAIIL